jgi:hypothetical protein
MIQEIRKIPLKRYRLLTSILNQDKEVYTSYNRGGMPFRINFDDLVRTIQINSDLYHRPIVELEDYGYLVRGNNIFFDAGVKAGLKSFICDINIRTLDDRHMSQFQLMDVIPARNDYRAVFIFFLNTNLTGSADFNGCSSFSDEINYRLSNDGYGGKALFEVIDCETVEFTVKKGEFSVNESLDCANHILSDFGEIRSVNGLVSKEDTYSDLLLPG